MLNPVLHIRDISGNTESDTPTVSLCTDTTESAYASVSEDTAASSPAADAHADEPDRGGDSVPTPVATPAAPPAAWGNPPTPLLPRWHLEAMAAVPLSPLLQALLADGSGGTPPQVIGDLASFWEHRSQPLHAKARSPLFDLVAKSRHAQPPWRHEVVPAGVDLSRLLACPLSARALNHIKKALALGRFIPGPPVLVGDLLSLHRFGIASLLDVMCVTEAAVDSGFLAAQPETTDTTPAPVPAAPSEPASAAPVASDPEAVHSPARATEALTSLAEFHESLSPIHRLILRERIFTDEPMSLAEIGRRVGLTGEAIRRSQKRVKARLHRISNEDCAFVHWMRSVATAIGDAAGPVVAADDLEKRISGVLPREPGARQADDHAIIREEAGETDGSGGDADERASAPDAPDPDIVASVARQWLRRELGYTCNRGVCLNGAAVRIVEDLRDTAWRLADDVGLMDPSELLDRLPDDTWIRHWDTLVDLCDLYRINGRMALRDTARARVKAALMEIGRPATKEEIAVPCGLSPDSVGKQLSIIHSVVRADKTRWGLSEWIDEAYEGIAVEIMRRIEQDGGTTQMKRLVDELPRMFGVSENSVRAYVATPKFSLVNGRVSVADPSSLVLKPLSDVVHGYTDDGKPYWRFKVYDRYFNGYSVVGLPPEMAEALGCESESRVRIPVSDPPGCRPISVSWQLTSMAGATVGYLSEPLSQLGARDGDHALLIIDGPDGVSMRLDDTPDDDTPDAD